MGQQAARVWRAAGQSQRSSMSLTFFGFWSSCTSGTHSSAMMSFNFDSTAINFGMMAMLKCEMMAKANVEPLHDTSAKLT